MGMLDDVLKAFDRIPAWKRLQKIPTELDELKQRIGAIEAKISNKWPADVCRYCGERASRLYMISPRTDARGLVREEWMCEACQRVDHRMYHPPSGPVDQI